MCPTRAAAGRLTAILLAACLLAVPARAQDGPFRVDLRTRTPQPGELIVATVTAPADTTAVTLSARGEEWPAYRATDGTWRALIGIDLDTRAGPFEVVVRSRGSQDLEQKERLTVTRKAFRRRVLKVAPEYVNPPADTLERIQREAELTRDAYARTTTEPGWRNGFTRPVPDPANSSFGTRSVFNGESRNPHAGTDFLSPAGTPVHTPAPGRVVLARDLFFTGNTVIVDHGLGVFSMLAHLSRIDVRESQELTDGDVIGLVGATGRVTGPHLHWALRVGRARVDALSALALLPHSR